MALGEVAEPGELLGRLVDAALGEEEAWGLDQEEGRAEEEAAVDELDADGDEPLLRLARDVLLDAVVDEESDDGAELIGDFLVKVVSDGRQKMAGQRT